MQQTIQTNMSNDKSIANALQANTSPINDNCMVVLILLDINGEKFKCIFFNKQTTTTEIINKSLSITTTARYTGMVEVYAKSKYEINIKTLSFRICFNLYIVVFLCFFQYIFPICVWIRFGLLICSCNKIFIEVL